MKKEEKELYTTSYEKSQDWVQHYSSLILKVRISVFTLSVVIVALILGVSGKPDFINKKFPIEISELIAYLVLTYAVLISLFFNYESGYYGRLKRAVEAGCEIEKQFGFKGNCGYYNMHDHNRVIILYLCLVLIFTALFVVLGYGHISGTCLLLLSALPPVIFAVFSIRSGHGRFEILTRKKKNKKSKESKSN